MQPSDCCSSKLILSSRQQLRSWPRVPAAAYHGTAVSFHDRYASVLGAEALVETPRRGVRLQHPEIDPHIRVQGAKPSSGVPHERRPDPVALGRIGNMKIVDKGAPLGIVGAVRANEANQVFSIDRYLDELVAGRINEPLAPHSQPFLGEFSVKERIGKGAPIVLTPATRVKKRNSLCVGWHSWPILDHLPNTAAQRNGRSAASHRVSATRSKRLSSMSDSTMNRSRRAAARQPQRLLWPTRVSS